MAKKTFEIQMDYYDALHQADSLNEIARSLRNSADRELAECIGEIRHHWTGSNASAYLSKCESLRSSLTGLAENVEKTASTIRQIARNTYDAEMEANRLAVTRTY